MNTASVIKKINSGLLLLIVVYGFLWLFLGAYFSHPNAEDFSLTSAPKSEGVINAASHLLVTYDGRYFTNILHGINPMALGWLDGYKWTIAFNILFFVFSVWYFLQTLNGGKKKFQTLLLSSFFVAVHFALTPSLVHELYWLVSSFVYLYCWCFTLLWVSTLIRFYNSNSEGKKKLYFLLTSVFLVSSVGINEMMLVINAFLLAGFGLYHYYIYKREYYVLVLLSVLSFISYAFFIMCPGIRNRFSSFENEHHENHYNEIISKSLLDFSQEMFLLLSQGGIFIIYFIIVLVGFKDVLTLNLKLPSLSFRNRIFCVLACFVAVYLMIYAFYVPMGHEEFLPHRIYTSVWTGAQLSFLVLIIVFNSFKFQLIDRVMRQYLLFVSLCLFTFLFFTQKSNIQLLKHDYISGRLEGFDMQMKERYKILSEADQRQHCRSIAILEPLKDTPRSVHNDPDIQPNRIAAYWNKAYESYFEVVEVRFSSDTITKKDLIRDLLYE